MVLVKESVQVGFLFWSWADLDLKVSFPKVNLQYGSIFPKYSVSDLSSAIKGLITRVPCIFIIY